MLRYAIGIAALLLAATAWGEGGETIATATLVPGLPYSDSGITCDNVNDYDVACPYFGSTAPDVVYRLEPAVDVNVRIDLCNSDYDTKVYVYAADGTTVVDCNDDACFELQSSIQSVPLLGGGVYYIVVDGYGTACGDYNLDVAEIQPCVVPCPAGAVVEGEGPCSPGQEDVYNGG